MTSKGVLYVFTAPRSVPDDGGEGAPSATKLFRACLLAVELKTGKVTKNRLGNKSRAPGSLAILAESYSSEGLSMRNVRRAVAVSQLAIALDMTAPPRARVEAAKFIVANPDWLHILE